MEERSVSVPTEGEFLVALAELHLKRLIEFDASGTRMRLTEKGRAVAKAQESRPPQGEPEEPETKGP